LYFFLYKSQYTVERVVTALASLPRVGERSLSRLGERKEFFQDRRKEFIRARRKEFIPDNCYRPAELLYLKGPACTVEQQL
jgi:hypothetical protein